MLITVTPISGEPIDINPDHIVWVESVGGDRPHTKVYLSTREQVQVRESRAEINALCNPTITAETLSELQPAPPQMPGPSEFKSASDVAPVTESADEAGETPASTRKRK